MWKSCTLKTLRHRWRNLKTLINRKVFCAHEWEELVMLKCPFYPKQYAHSIQFPPKFQWIFSQKLNKQSWHLHGTMLLLLLLSHVSLSDSVRPHRQQPARLPRPWDSPGKNTGVGCHCLLRLISLFWLKLDCIYIFSLIVPVVWKTFKYISR